MNNFGPWGGIFYHHHKNPRSKEKRDPVRFMWIVLNSTRASVTRVAQIKFCNYYHLKKRIKNLSSGVLGL